MGEKTRALYYPYIKVPESNWFTRVLLYWDEVGAIVPYEYLENPDELGPYMVGLVRENLVRQVMPGAHLWQVDNFKPAFLDYVDGIDRAPVLDRDWPQIHMEKLQQLGEELVARNLATKDSDSRFSTWFKVEPNTASDFMAYLAGVLGQIGDEKFFPVTDEPHGLLPFVDPHSHKSAPIRKVVLEGILPAPTCEVEPGRIAEFKSKHENELRSFSRHLEDEISQLSLIQDQNDLKKRIQFVVNSMNDQIAELSARMEESKWSQLDFGSLCTVIGGGIASYQALQGSDYQLGLAGAALSIAPVVANAFIGSDAKMQDKPLAYAALASQKLFNR